MAIAVGSKAPEKTLKRKTAEGLQDVTLSECWKQGPVVLLFFPLAFTGVCQEEMCAISEGLSDFENLDATVFGISVDSPFAQEAWAHKEKIQVPLLSDFNKETAEAYGVLYEDLLGLQGVAKRSAFVIDPSGSIQYSWVTEDPKILPDFEAIKKALEEVKATKA